MKTKILFFLFSFLFFLEGNAQQSVNAGGGEATSSQGKVSFTIGQIDYVTVTGSGGSVSQGVQQPYEIFTLGTDEIPAISLEFSTYPNPTTNVLFIKNNLTNKKFQYQLFDISGKLLFTSPEWVQEVQIDMSLYQTGNYILLIQAENNLTKSFKIIKK
ncbi:hypothetical protein B0A58_13795 [Flavobacterium branchiophilum NBRC 15030 = ATCC 35035]|uniref:Putative secreted protein (Por secretion system target) n=1 Tax=Flavobacterium branchiophilum TaxID=55197 RepID=A0A543G543_9FLAO|nr:T9SS type A sorting domain-containing protein [Flavobacterium branchiophilum]OXA71351.1 hypothetical protein B0A58_13795 [Flavobacterium branchiophilum NBRC 15030 = ATCC 35035]TQM41202.1 putative secreted protein (Por secretion system target) [Flavobacterium branchiophilum]GEM56458.1 hypothetical protein FB1_26790 [Flavobacterium branchiophilum NBRC 15030 = ATCC 35035]